MFLDVLFFHYMQTNLGQYVSCKIPKSLWQIDGKPHVGQVSGDHRYNDLVGVVVEARIALSRTSSDECNCCLNEWIVALAVFDQQSGVNTI